MTALRFDVDDVLRTEGRFDELFLLRARTGLGTKLTAFVSALARGRLDALGGQRDAEAKLEREVEGLRAQNAQLTNRLQEVEIDLAKARGETLTEAQQRFDTKRFWETCRRAAAEVATWPDWKKAAAAKACNGHEKRPEPVDRCRRAIQEEPEP